VGVVRVAEILEWQGEVGRTWAREWRRTDRSFTGLTDRLLAAARSLPFGRALDIGCGAGEVSLALARIHTGAQVLGVDLAEPLVDVARDRGRHLANLAFECGDAAEWSRPGWQPDLLVSRHGVMFFPDPHAAFRHLSEQATPDARLVFSCFRARQDNFWADGIDALVPAEYRAPFDPHAPGPFAFADADRVGAILEASGWGDVLFEAVDYALVAGTGENALDDAESYFLAIGPAARVARTLPEPEREAFVARLRRFLDLHRDGDLIVLKAAGWIVNARRVPA